MSLVTSSISGFEYISSNCALVKAFLLEPLGFGNLIGLELILPSKIALE